MNSGIPKRKQNISISDFSEEIVQQERKSVTF